MAIGITSSLGYLALLQRRTDVDTGFWARVWRGPLGRLAFSIAKRSGGARPAVAAMTHRATELSLGLAAEQLFESLAEGNQNGTRRPASRAARLQNDAQSLRARYESLQEALSGKMGSDPEYEDLRAMRDDMHARLGEAVGSLETMRLGLLRLHAGSQTVEGLTTHLGIAAEVSAQVARLVSAHQDVEKRAQIPKRNRTNARLKLGSESNYRIARNRIRVATRQSFDSDPEFPSHESLRLPRFAGGNQCRISLPSPRNWSSTTRAFVRSRNSSSVITMAARIAALCVSISAFAPNTF